MERIHRGAVQFCSFDFRDNLLQIRVKAVQNCCAKYFLLLRWNQSGGLLQRRRTAAKDLTVKPHWYNGQRPNSYNLHLRFELLFWHMVRYKCRLLTYSLI